MYHILLGVAKWAQEQTLRKDLNDSSKQDLRLLREMLLKVARYC